MGFYRGRGGCPPPQICICFLFWNQTHNFDETWPQPLTPVMYQGLFMALYINPEVFTFFSIIYFGGHLCLPVVAWLSYPATTRWAPRGTAPCLISLWGSLSSFLLVQLSLVQLWHSSASRIFSLHSWGLGILSFSWFLHCLVQNHCCEHLTKQCFLLSFLYLSMISGRNALFSMFTLDGIIRSYMSGTVANLEAMSTQHIGPIDQLYR